MNLLKLNINKILLLDEYNFNSPLNNIDYLNNQAALVESLEEKLKLLTRAAEIIEKFHSFFHFEQSYFHLKLAILYGESEEAIEQLKLAIFQDPINKQAKLMLEGSSDNQNYQRPFNSFVDYLSFATNEEIETFKPQGYWHIKQNTAGNIKHIIEEIRHHHLHYHEEAAKLYLNRALIFYLLKESQLAKNNIIKAHNLDNKLAQKEYYNMIMAQIGKEVVLGLGSNLGDRKNYLNQAVEILQKLNIIQNITVSSIIESKADLLPNSPKEWDLDYFNMAIKAITILTCDELLQAIKDVEQIIGKRTGPTWSPREIDIDILAYSSEVIKNENLQVPHKNLLERSWAMEPFVEVWPDWVHPVMNKNIKEIYDEKSKTSRNS
jgi:2-amino-4-hydroxy-6-hydroxymethyldihydropteridine diphosphokinase